MSLCVSSFFFFVISRVLFGFGWAHLKHLHYTLNIRHLKSVRQYISPMDISAVLVFFTLFECELPFFVCPPFNFVQHQLDYRHIQGADSSLDICGIFSVYLCAVDCMFSAVDSFRVCVCVCVCVCVDHLFG